MEYDSIDGAEGDEHNSVDFVEISKIFATKNAIFFWMEPFLTWVSLASYLQDGEGICCRRLASIAAIATYWLSLKVKLACSKLAINNSLERGFISGICWWSNL